MIFHQSFRLIQNEKKVRRKSKRWSILFILLLLLLLFFPFITQKIQDEQKVVGILVDFAQEETFDNSSSSSSAQKSSSRAASATEEAPAEEAPAPSEPTAQPETQPQPEPPQPKAADVTPLPTRKSNPITESAPREINFESMLANISKSAQVEEVSEEVVEVTEELNQESMDEIAEYFKNSSRGEKKSKSSGTSDSSSGSNTPDSGTSASAGEGDSGSSDSGNSSTDGKSDQPGDDGKGSSPGDGIDFDGKINREVVYRSNFSGLAKEDGVIVISLCINRDGKVIYSKANKAKSSYKDAATLKRAELIVKKNRYKRDYTVAERQCGSYTYIIKGVE